MQLVKSKLIRFQIRHAQSGTVGVSELDLEEPVVSDEDDVVVCCRIEFVGSLGIAGYRVAWSLDKGDNKDQVCGRCELTRGPSLKLEI